MSTLNYNAVSKKLKEIAVVDGLYQSTNDIGDQLNLSAALGSEAFADYVLNVEDYYDTVLPGEELGRVNSVNDLAELVVRMNP